MVSITHGYANSPHKCRRWWQLLLLLVLGCANAQAGDVVGQSGELTARYHYYTVRANFTVKLKPELVQALEQGVPLRFKVEFDVTQPRWYSTWRYLADGFGVSANMERELSYHAISRQYRIASAGITTTYTTLDDALAALGDIQGWKVLAIDSANRGLQLGGRVRLRMDTEHLPQPFQLQNLGDSAWNLSSDWMILELAETTPPKHP